jgi:hypothetical protein
MAVAGQRPFEKKIISSMQRDFVQYINIPAQVVEEDDVEWLLSTLQSAVPDSALPKPLVVQILPEQLKLGPGVSLKLIKKYQTILCIGPGACKPRPDACSSTYCAATQHAVRMSSRANVWLCTAVTLPLLLVQKVLPAHQTYNACCAAGCPTWPIKFPIVPDPKGAQKGLEFDAGEHTCDNITPTTYFSLAQQGTRVF